ncbi:hypothetical protein EBT31_20200, partial [bacterium]|nr:hypothetical protein [bacterium]
MAIHGYPGQILSATAPTVSPVSASGVWTLVKQLYYQGQGSWPPFSVEYLVVAGGGSGGGTSVGQQYSGGGGGAGGFRTGTGLAITAGATYAVTIGAGG